MALGQLDRIEELLGLKRKIFQNYKRELKGLKVRFNKDNSKCRNGLWATVINFDEKYKVNIPKLIKFLARKKNFCQTIL